MKKSRKLFIFVLIMAMFLVPMLTSCEEEVTPPDLKAEFLTKLEQKVAYNANKIKVVATGATIEVTFEIDAADAKIQEVAGDIVDALRDLTAAGTQVTIDGKSYALHDDAKISEFRAAMITLFSTNKTENYTATIKYGGDSFSLSGTLKITDQRP